MVYISPISFYEDDSLIFCEPDIEEILHLRMILLFLEAMSGLLINYAKSVLCPVNGTPNLQEIAGILGFTIGTSPTTSFGLQLGAKATTTTIWDDILEK